MDELHLLAALRYVALNRFRARLVERTQDWPWSSTRALLAAAQGDGLAETAPMLDRVPDFAALLRLGEEAALSDALLKSEGVGRPLVTSEFLDRIEVILGHNPKPGKRGPKPKGT